MRLAPSLVFRFSVGDQVFLTPNILYNILPALMTAGLSHYA